MFLHYITVLCALLLVLTTNIHAKEYVAPKKEKRLVIALLDSGLDTTNPDFKPYLCNLTHKSFVMGGLNNDSIGHGTVMFKIISRLINPKKACIVVYKTVQTYVFSEYNFVAGIEEAINNNATIINMSAGGDNPIEREKKIIKKALNHGIYFVTAAGNDRINLKYLCNYYPACYGKELNSNNFIVVGAMDLSQSNYNGPVNAFETGHFENTSGTSVATAIHSGKLSIRLIKWKLMKNH